MKAKKKKAIWTQAFPGQAVDEARRKKRQEFREYQIEKYFWLQTHARCQVCKEKMAYDVHHKRGRGKLLRVKRYWLAVCRSCHDSIHMKPDLARSQGYLAKRGEWRKA